MNYNINFQKAKRNYMVLTFDDEADGEEFVHTIQVGMPKKKIFDALLDLQEIMEKIKEVPEEERNKSENSRKQIDEMYTLVSIILSNNLVREHISKEWVEEQMTFEEVREFLTQYVKFCKGEAANPN